jgi:hypothetical protein
VTTARRETVLVVLDDASAATALLDASSALAQLTGRELQLVYVESVAALTAATLPTTRVLAPAAHAWAPLEPRDVELGWRAQAARLHTLADRAMARRSVRWTMRVTRGAMQEVTRTLSDESDLLMVGLSPARFAAASARAARPLIVAIDDGSEAGREAQRIAQGLAEALGGRLRVRPVGSPCGQADLVVTTGDALPAATLADWRAPLLIVRPEPDLPVRPRD